MKGRRANTRNSPEQRRNPSTPDKGGEPASCNFDVAGLITHVVLLGNIAIRTGKKLQWDAENMKITNDSDANRYIREEYRSGWSL